MMTGPTMTSEPKSKFERVICVLFRSDKAPYKEHPHSQEHATARLELLLRV